MVSFYIRGEIIVHRDYRKKPFVRREYIGRYHRTKDTGEFKTIYWKRTANCSRKFRNYEKNILIGNVGQ